MTLAFASTLVFLELKTVGAPGHLVQVKHFPVRAVHRLSTRLGVDEERVVAVMGMSIRTYQRRKKGREPLREDEADRALRVARITERAYEVFGSPEKAQGWLQTYIPPLQAIPLDLSATDAGAHAVEEELLRIEHGILA